MRLGSYDDYWILYYEKGSGKRLLFGNWWAILDGELLDKWFLTIYGLTIDILFIEVANVCLNKIIKLSNIDLKLCVKLVDCNI
jgi:hypothetical protein